MGSGIKIPNVEIFRAGAGDFTVADVRAMASDYDPKVHRAPLTKDHEQWGEAMGWIENVVAKGSRLFCDFVNVAPEFYACMSAGKWRHRSVEIYPQFAATGRPYLKAVSMLGAAAPAVKGMADIQFACPGEFKAFASDGLEEIAFSSPIVEPEQPAPEVSSHTASAGHADAAPISKEDRMSESTAPGAAPPAPPAPVPDVARFAELEKSLESERKARADAEAKFSETTARVAKLEAELFAEREGKRFDAAYDAAFSEGRITTAQRASKLAVFNALPAGGDTFQFAEGKSGTARDAFLHDLRSAPVVVEFGDRIARDGTIPGGKPADKTTDPHREFRERVEKHAKDKGISFSDAFDELANGGR